MSFVTAPSSVIKGDRNDVFFDKDQFISAVTIPDPYFANERNWKRIVLVYMDPNKKQKQFAIVSDNFSRANFEPSEIARTGLWTLEEIRIFDKHQDQYVVTRASMPSPENFDVQAQRIVAPSPLVTSIEVAVDINNDGDFAVATVEEAGWTQITSNGSSAVIESDEVKLQTGGPGLSTIKLEKTFSLEAGERYVLKYKTPTRNAGIKDAGNVVFEDNASVYADGTAPIAEPSGQAGWYYKNDGQNIGFSGLDKINWYFFDGSVQTETIDSVLTGYAVGEIKGTEPFHLAIYTFPQGDGNDAGSWYRSRIVYVPANGSYEQNKKYLFVTSLEDTPANLYPDLERVEMVPSQISTVGPQDPSEQILTASLGTNSAAQQNSVEILINNVGYVSSVNGTVDTRFEITGFPTPGIINDLGVFIRNASNTVIESSVESTASASEKSISFIAPGTTKVSFECSGEYGFWTLDDVVLEKNPDALTVPLAEVQHYRVGFKVMLWDVVANDYLTPDVYTIEKIDVDVLTFDKPIAGPYTGKTLLLKFPDYDNSSADQKGLYQYVGRGY